MLGCCSGYSIVLVSVCLVVVMLLILLSVMLFMVILLLVEWDSGWMMVNVLRRLFWCSIGGWLLVLV